MADGHRKWPGETDNEFQARLIEELERREGGSPRRGSFARFVERKRRPGETDEAFAERVLKCEADRVRKQRSRQRPQNHASGRTSARPPMSHRDASDAGHSDTVTDPVTPKRPEMSQPDGTAKVIRMVARKPAEVGAKVPTLYGVPVAIGTDASAPDRDIERDIFRDQNGTGPRTFLERGVGGRGLSGCFPPSFGGENSNGQTDPGDVTPDTDVTGRDAVTAAASGNGEANLAASQGNNGSANGGGYAGDRDGGRDGSGHGGGGGRCDCGVTLSRLEDVLRRQRVQIEHLAEHIKESRRMASYAMGRAEGLAKMLLTGAPSDATAIEEVTGLAAVAAATAEREFEQATEIRMGEHGQLVPLNVDAVLAASARVDETTAAFLDSARVGSEEEPHIDEALDHVWRMLMFLCYVTSEQEASVSLTPPKIFCLQEMLRSSEQFISAERGETPFAMFAQWVELYARDASIKRSQKSPENMLVRIQFYVQASYPKENPWTPSRAVQAWRQIVGRPPPPVVLEDTEPGESNRG